jgi:hypothetical protein
MEDDRARILAERANLETTRRDEMMNNAVKGLLLANGGGAVALLAFLQAIWREQDAPLRSMVAALILMALGVIFAALVLLLRYITAYEHQRGSKTWCRWRKGYLSAAFGSLVMFALSVATIAVGILICR